MNIRFNSIILDGFMSFDREEISLTDLGIVSIKGKNYYEPLAESNGSGKSAISEAIIYTLTGSTSRGASEVANTILNKGVMTTLDLDIDDINYVITRSKNHCDYGTSLIIKKNGEDISGNTFTKSKAILAAELGASLDYDTLTAIIILSQGLPGRLSTLKPSSRKSRLEELSKTDHYIDELQNKIAIAIAELNLEFNKINSELMKCSTLINSSNFNITNNQSKISAIHEKSGELITKELAEKLELEVIPEINSEIKSINDSISNTSSMIIRLDSQLKVIIRDFEQARVFNEQSFAKYQSLVASTCPTCHQVIQNANDLEALRATIDNEMKQNKVKMIQLLENKSEIEKSLPELHSQLELAREELSNKESEKQVYESQLSDYKNYNSSTSILEEAILRDSIIIEENQIKKVELEDQLSAVKEQIDIANYYKNQLSRKFRSFLLEGVISYLNHKSVEYSSYLFEKQGNVTLDIEGNNINIYLGDRPFEDLSGGEGRRVDIILQLVQRDLARNESGFSSNLLVLDEILDNLDAVGAESVIRLLEFKSPDINSMLIVSHKQDITVPHDKVILVNKGEDQISRIYKGE